MRRSREGGLFLASNDDYTPPTESSGELGLRGRHGMRCFPLWDRDWSSRVPGSSA